jgi:hypothetical protein
VSYPAGRDSDPRRELHLIWVSAANPASARAAAETAERLICTDPLANGQLLCEGLWRIVVSPLAVYYTIDAARRHVQITDVLETV